MPDFTTSVPLVVAIALGAYLLGSVPFGIVVSRLCGLPDPRSIGSGNIGATNVLRSGSKAAALATLVLDAAKGAVAVVAARQMAGDDAVQIAALASLLGHLYPVWLRFRGGKGVATLLGVLIALDPTLGVIAVVGWLFTFFVFRYSSLSALMAALVTPPVAVIVGFGDMLALLVVMAALVVWRHRTNIERLRDGSEPMVRWGRE